jgi:hypothetical protein
MCGELPEKTATSGQTGQNGLVCAHAAHVRHMRVTDRRQLHAEMDDEGADVELFHVGCLRADQAGYAKITSRPPEPVGAERGHHGDLP